MYFDWRIFALPYCAGFCQTSTWISHRFTYTPSLLNLPPTPVCGYGALAWVPPVTHQIPIDYLFSIWWCKFPCHSPHTSHPPLSPRPTVSISLLAAVFISSDSKLAELFCPRRFFFFKFISFNWRLISLQYCTGFCHTSTWISHGCTCAPHPEPLSHLPPHPIPQGRPRAPFLWTSSLRYIKVRSIGDHCYVGGRV